MCEIEDDACGLAGGECVAMQTNPQARRQFSADAGVFEADRVITRTRLLVIVAECRGVGWAAVGVGGREQFSGTVFGRRHQQYVVVVGNPRARQVCVREADDL